MKISRWPIIVTALVTVAIIAIGGVVWYGTVQMPVDRKNADVKACNIFALGLVTARSKATTLLEKSPPESDANVAQAYLDAVDKGIDEAFLAAASKGDVANALAQLGLARINYDATQGFDAITTLENSYDPVKTACEAVMPTASATPAATN